MSSNHALLASFLGLLLCASHASADDAARARKFRQAKKVQNWVQEQNGAGAGMAGRGRQMPALLPLEGMNPKPGLTDCTDVAGNAEAFAKIYGGSFDYVVGIVNSISWCIQDNANYFQQIADAVWKADVDSNFDNRLIWNLAGVVGKAVFDNLVLDRSLEKQIAFSNYLISKGAGSSVNPNSGTPIMWSTAVMYLQERGGLVQAGRVLNSAIQAGGNAADYTAETLNVAVRAKGCDAISPIFDSAKSQGGGAALAAWAAPYEALARCVNTGSFRDPGLDYSVDLATKDYRNAVNWARLILSGTPSGVGTANMEVNNKIIRDATRFGIAEKGASALVMQLLQGGDVAAAARAELAASFNLYGCQPLAVTLVDAEGISRAMGIAATFKAELAKDQRMIDCLNKGLLAFLYN